VPVKFPGDAQLQHPWVSSGAPFPSQAAVSLLAGEGRCFPPTGTASSTLSTQDLPGTCRPERSLSEEVAPTQITAQQPTAPTDLLWL